jgi:hypothetical protein
VACSSQTDHFVEEIAPFQNAQKSGEKNYIVMGSGGTETKNDYAGEGQQKFTGWTALH